MIPRTEWMLILEAACRAMSPYNTQPWRFRWDGDGVEIFLLRTKNFFLKLGGISYMTLGHLLENFSTAARALGYKAEIQLLGPHLNLDFPIARVTLKPVSEPEPTLLNGLERRVTNRLPFSSRPLEGRALEVLREGLGKEVGSRVHWLTDEEQVIASGILADLERVRLSNYKLFKEACDFIRFDAEEYVEARDRLYVDSLGLTPGSQRWLKLLMDRPYLHRSAKILMPHMLRRERERKRREFMQAAGLLVYVVECEDPPSYVALGRRIQRMLNNLAAVGVQSHVVLSGLYLLHLAFENIEIFSRVERDLILFALRDLENLISASSRRIAFVVRVGTCEQWPEPTLRKETLSLFLPSSSHKGHEPPLLDRKL